MSKYSKLIVRKLKSGKYQGILKYKDSSGKWRQTTKVSKQKLKRDAVPELEQWEKEMNLAAEQMPEATPQQHKQKGENTIENVVSAYLDYQFKKGELEKSTYSRQRTTLAIYLTPYIGDYVFTDIDRVAIERWLTALADKGLKQSTIHMAFALLNKVYRYFCRIGDISHNPCEYVKTPKKGDPKVTYMDTPQTRHLLKCCNDDLEEGGVLWTAINIALYGGLRRGEICGLRWYDVDFDSGYLNVTSSIGISSDGTYTKSPKNKSSVRRFPMIEPLRNALESRRRKVQEDYGTIASNWFVIGDTIHYKPPTTLATEFTRFVRKHEIKDHFGKYVTLHTLRHNLATIGVKSHMDIASLAEMMGHASKAMTLDTYSSASPDAMELAAERLGEAFENDKEPEGDAAT